MIRKSKRLDTVLRVRKIHEDLAGQYLALANKGVVLAIKEKDNRVAHYNSLSFNHPEQSQEEFLRERQTLQIAADSIGYSQKALLQAQAVQEQRRTYYVQARKNVKIIEKLKERRVEDEQRVQELELVKTIDDISSTRWIGARDNSYSEELQ